MSFLARSFAASLVGTSAVLTLLAAAHSDEPDWLPAAMEGWRRLESVPLPTAWTAKYETTNSGKTTYQYIISHRSGDQFAHFLVDSNQPVDVPEDPFKIAQESFLRNGDYFFRVRRQAVDKPWTLVHVVRASDVDDRERNTGYDWTHTIMTDLGNAIRWTPVTVEGILLSDLFESKFIENAKATKLVRDGKELYRVEFTKQSTPKDYWFPKIQRQAPVRFDANVVLDPENDWRLVEGVVQPYEGEDVKREWKTEFVITYDPETGRMLEHRESLPVLRVVSSLVFDDIRYDTEYPASDFRLPAFGIPEPPELQPRRSYWHWYLAAGMVGVLLIVIGVKLKRKKR